tara:strand:- start:1662 stop:3248 length:1587 start_codon:yes stop_codon:yes gene_type:complete
LTKPRNLKNLSNFLGLLLLIAISQSSCRTAKDKERITVASAGKISSIDPAQANTFQELQLLSALGDTLYKVNSDGIIQPELAAGMPQFSDNGLTISIPLRRDVYFHDGTKFDAEAMAFTLERFKEIGTLSYLLGDRIKSIETPEQYIIKIKLSRRSASIISLLSSINLTPVSPIYYKKYTNKFLNNRFIGTGPYKLSYFNNQQQRIVPFSRYWGRQPKNKGIDLINLSNSTALYGAMRSGEVDILLSNSINETQRLSLHKLSLKGIINEGIGSPNEIGFITLKSNSNPFHKNKIRKAIMYSLDRETIVSRVSFGLREPFKSLIPPHLRIHKNSYWPKYSPSKAKQLLLEEGYCNGKILTIPITFRSNVPTDKLLALTWQSQINRDLSDCIEIQPNGVESTTVYKQLSKGSFNAVILDWRGSYQDAEAYISPFASCTKTKGLYCTEGESVMSGSFWTKAGLQEELNKSDQILSKLRLRKLEDIEKYIADGASYLPVWLVKPRAWSQLQFSKPKFDVSGHLLLEELTKLD